jgi:hypothetical protein
MFRRAQVSWSRGVYALNVIDTPMWATAIGAAYESAMARAGHPCCGGGLCARLPQSLGDRLFRLASAGLKMTGRLASDRERVALKILISAETGERLLGFSIDLDDKVDQEGEDEQSPTSD